MELGRFHKTMAGMEDGVAQFGRNVALARRRLHLTQEDVSGRSGVHPTEVSRIENGDRDVRISTVFRLAAALELSPGQLLDGSA